MHHFKLLSLFILTGIPLLLVNASGSYYQQSPQQNNPPQPAYGSGKLTEHKADKTLFRQLAWFEYLGHLGVEIELPCVTYLMIQRLKEGAYLGPSLQGTISAAIALLKRRLGARKAMVPISMPGNMVSNVPDVGTSRLDFPYPASSELQGPFFQPLGQQSYGLGTSDKFHVNDKKGSFYSSKCPYIVERFLEPLLGYRDLVRASQIIGYSPQRKPNPAILYGPMTPDQELVAKLRLMTDIIQYDRVNYAQCAPLWDNSWRGLTWRDKQRILDSFASGDRYFYGMSGGPKAASVNVRILLAQNQREASLRAIEGASLDEFEYVILQGCWQQKFDERGLEDALPTYEMALTRAAETLGDGPKHAMLRDIMRDLEEGIATGRWDLAIHVGPFMTVFPKKHAVHPVPQETDRTQKIKSNLDKDLLLQRFQQLVQLANPGSSAGAQMEKETMQKIQQLTGRLQELQNRAQMADTLHQRLTAQEREESLRQQAMLQAQLKDVLSKEWIKSAELELQRKRQHDLDSALATFNQQIQSLRQRYDQLFKQVMPLQDLFHPSSQQQQHGPNFYDRNNGMFQELQRSMSREESEIRAHYDAAVQRIERGYLQALQQLRMGAMTPDDFDWAWWKPGAKRPEPPPHTTSPNGPFNPAGVQFGSPHWGVGSPMYNGHGTSALPPVMPYGPQWPAYFNEQNGLPTKPWWK